MCRRVNLEYDFYTIFDRDDCEIVNRTRCIVSCSMQFVSVKEITEGDHGVVDSVTDLLHRAASVRFPSRTNDNLAYTVTLHSKMVNSEWYHTSLLSR